MISNATGFKILLLKICWSYVYISKDAKRRPTVLLMTCAVQYFKILANLPSVLDTVGWAAGRASSLQKTEWWGARWLSVWSEVQLMPLPLTVSCFTKIQIGFTFPVLAHLGSPEKRAVKRVCVCVCVLSFNGIFAQQPG